MINISKRICVGWKNPSSGELPSGTIAPLGNSASEKKRINSVLALPNNKEYDNKPLPGFTIEDHGRKRYSTSTTTYNVIDPRGFKVEITSENLIDIVQISGITEGLIQDKCVWVRHDSRTGMILLPVISEDYKEAVENTILLNNKVKISDVQIGDTVMTQSGKSGVYMGTHTLYAPLAEVSRVFRNRYQPQSFPRRQIIKVDDWYYYASDAKILSVVKKTNNPMTKEEAAVLINSTLEPGKTYFSPNPHGSNVTLKKYYSVHGMIAFVSPKNTKPTLSLEEITQAEFNVLFDRGYVCDDIGLIVCEKADGTRYIVDYDGRTSSNTTPPNPPAFSCTQIDTISESELVLKDERANYWYYSNRNRPDRKNENFTTFKKFYKIIKNVKDESYV
jgi:hypothetical protein